MCAEHRPAQEFSSKPLGDLVKAIAAARDSALASPHAERPPLETTYRFGPFEVLPALRQLQVDGQPAILGSRAFDLLLVLIEHRERVLGKDELLALVWPGVVVEKGNLSVQISALRKLLGADAIATVIGRGYRFDLQASQAPAKPAESVRPAISPPHKPSIAVLPFTNMSGDPAHRAVVFHRRPDRRHHHRPVALSQPARQCQQPGGESSKRSRPLEPGPGRGPSSLRPGCRQPAGAFGDSRNTEKKRGRAPVC